MNQNNMNVSGVLLGVLIGGLAGAVTMLLLAPQSGEETRSVIQKKGIELRDRTSDLMEDTMSQFRSSAKKITVDGRKQIGELKKQGKDMAMEQLNRVSDAVQAGKSAIKNT